MSATSEQIHFTFFSHVYFVHLIVFDFVRAAGQSDHAPLSRNHNASHAFAAPAAENGVQNKHKQIAGTHREKPYTQTQKEGPRWEQKSYSTPYIDSGLDKHNTHKRVTP